MSAPVVARQPPVEGAATRRTRRRWWAIPITAFVLVGGAYAGLSDAPPRTVGIAATAALAANLLYTLLLRAPAFRRLSLPVSAALDLSLITVVVAFTGHGGIALLYLLAIAPYVFDWSGLAAPWMPPAAGILWALGWYAHARWYLPPQGISTVLDLPAAVYVDAVLLWLAAWVLFRGPARLVARLRGMRATMEEAARGDLAVRAPGVADD